MQMLVNAVSDRRTIRLEVGWVANFAGYRIRVPGRYYPAGSGPDPGT